MASLLILCLLVGALALTILPERRIQLSDRCGQVTATPAVEHRLRGFGEGDHAFTR